MKPDLIIVTGATASGKSAAIYSLPTDTPIEVINADARQVYQGMEIGTAMPSVAEREKFPHHLFGFLTPDKQMTVGIFFREAVRLIPEIRARGNIPLICGGSYFYIKTLLDGLSPEPVITEAARKAVQQLPLAEQLELLRQYDPVSYEKIDRRNPVRVARALLVTLSGDKPFSAYRPEGGLRHKMNIELLCTELSREQLYANIEQRTAQMLQRGLLAETRALLAAGYQPSDPGLNTIGYREVLSFLQEGDFNSATAIPPAIGKQLEQEIVRHTKQFAKRQLTWFRSEKELKKVDPLRLTAYLSRCLSE